MIKFEVTQDDLSCLGYPQDIKREIYIAYYHWIKEGKNPLEFKYTYERSIEYVDKFIKDWEWLK